MDGFWIKLNETGRKILVSKDNKTWEKASYSFLVDLIIYLSNKNKMEAQDVVSSN